MHLTPGHPIVAYCNNKPPCPLSFTLGFFSTLPISYSPCITLVLFRSLQLSTLVRFQNSPPSIVRRYFRQEVQNFRGGAQSLLKF